MPSPPESVRIRAAGTEDAERLLALWAAADAEPSTTDTVEAIVSVINHAPGSVVIAEVAGQVVGSLIATWDGWRGNMYRLAVHPDYRRRSIASQLAVRRGIRLSLKNQFSCESIGQQQNRPVPRVTSTNF